MMPACMAPMSPLVMCGVPPLPVMSVVVMSALSLGKPCRVGRVLRGGEFLEFLLA